MVHKIAHEKNKDIFTGWAQNDMTEFLQFITDCFHTSISRPRLAEKEYSEITELFYGTYSSKIMSIENGDTHTTNNETFFVLDLPIPENIPEPTLYDCFRKFTEKEILGEDNKWYNEKTGLHENIMKQYDFIKFPHILVIMLKRFRHDTINKNGVLVNFPFEMDLGEFCGATAQYSLYGVCNHFGNALFGHYTSFVKTATNEWIHFNDETLEKIAPQGVVTTAAYCLFYRRAGVI
jgi:ubiquitin C-terminal hydrolase